MNVRLRRPLDLISGRPRDVRLGRQDVRLGRPGDGQIGSLGDFLGTLEGDVLWTFRGPIFAGWGLTGEDLGLKPSTVEQAKFEYSALGKIFNKGLSEEDKKEGLLKKLNNIEGKNEEQLQAIEDQGKNN